MNQSDRELLQKMIAENDVVDNTNLIREQKISDKIKQEVEQLIISIKQHKHMEDSPEYKMQLAKCCPLLSTKYNKIFNKFLDKTINMDILSSLINELKRIENNEINQHEASYSVGKILKQQFIDEKLGLTEEQPKDNQIQKKDISWEEYKNMQKNKRKVKN